MRKELIYNIEKFLNKLSFTIYTKNRLKEILLRYEDCRIKNSNHYEFKIEEIDKQKFYKHLIGFIDGDGSLRSGKRVGHKKGLFRFVPNMVIKLHKCDKNYLELIARVLDLGDKNIHIVKMKNDIQINFSMSSKSDMEFFMYIIDNYQLFLTQKKVRDYLLIKKLYEYLDSTKLIIHDLLWVEKGLNIIKDLNTYNNLQLVPAPRGSADDKFLNYILENINIEYIIGFIEAEGSFVLHEQKSKNHIHCSFEITQNKENGLILKGILNFIKNYNDPLIIEKDIKITTKGIIEDKGKSRKSILNRMVLTNNELLLNKIIPLMVSSDFYTKKQINLVYWIFGVIICNNLKDYEECVNLYLKIKEVINTNSTDLLDLNEILIIINKYL